MQKKFQRGLAGKCILDLLAPKEEVFDPLLPQRLAEFETSDMGSNTPMRPEGTVADIYVYVLGWRA